SVRVKVETKKPHPMYGKIIKSHKSYIAHDEENKCQIGDIVEIQEVRPISKRKSWMVININSKQV
ncbi:MAG TPA: 30S ribosomal protein S17, partial [Candidatus Dojkabacteria bacterium]